MPAGRFSKASLTGANTVNGPLLWSVSTSPAALTAATEDGYRRADFLALNPDLDDEGLGTAIHWDTYFGVDKDRYYKDKDAASTAERVTARKSSVAALSGNPT